MSMTVPGPMAWTDEAASARTQRHSNSAAKVTKVPVRREGQQQQ